MEKETSAVTKLGIGLAALAVLIGISLTIFVTARKGSTNTIDSVIKDTNNIHAYDVYNNELVSGNDVMDAVRKYINSDLAILICTQDWVTKGLDQYGNVKNAEGLSSYGTPVMSGGTSKVPLALLYASKRDANAMTGAYNLNSLESILGNDGEYHNLIAVNYGALLGSSSYSNKGVANRQVQYNDNTKYYVPNIYFDNTTGTYICTSGFADYKTSLTKNSNIDNLGINGAVEYVNPETRFNSRIITSETGDVMGILFVEYQLGMSKDVNSENTIRVTITIDGEEYDADLEYSSITGQYELSLAKWLSSDGNLAHSGDSEIFSNGRKLGLNGQTVTDSDGYGVYSVSESGEKTLIKGSTKITASGINPDGSIKNGKNLTFEIDKPNKIYFQIGDDIYAADEGMTFEDWQSSKYNYNVKSPDPSYSDARAQDYDNLPYSESTWYTNTEYQQVIALLNARRLPEFDEDGKELRDSENKIIYGEGLIDIENFQSALMLRIAVDNYNATVSAANRIILPRVDTTTDSGKNGFDELYAQIRPLLTDVHSGKYSTGGPGVPFCYNSSYDKLMTAFNEGNHGISMKTGVTQPISAGQKYELEASQITFKVAGLPKEGSEAEQTVKLGTTLENWILKTKPSITEGGAKKQYITVQNDKIVRFDGYVLKFVTESGNKTEIDYSLEGRGAKSYIVNNGFYEFEPGLISFKINGINYQANFGMTFGEWVGDTTFNNDAVKFTINSDKTIRVTNSAGQAVDSGILTKAGIMFEAGSDQVIENGKDYGYYYEDVVFTIGNQNYIGTAGKLFTDFLAQDKVIKVSKDGEKTEIINPFVIENKNEDGVSIDRAVLKPENYIVNISTTETISEGAIFKFFPEKFYIGTGSERYQYTSSGKTYDYLMAEPGMTWSDWLASSYNSTTTYNAATYSETMTTMFEFEGGSIQENKDSNARRIGKPTNYREAVGPGDEIEIGATYTWAPIMKTFSIGMFSYDFEDGMTLEDWVNSIYNVTKEMDVTGSKGVTHVKQVQFAIDGNVVKSARSKVTNMDRSVVNKTVRLQQGTTYYLLLEKIQFKVGSYTMTAEKGMTWSEWLSDTANNYFKVEPTVYFEGSGSYIKLHGTNRQIRNLANNAYESKTSVIQGLDVGASGTMPQYNLERLEETFQIGGVTYRFMSDMTFGEWLSSSYNTGGWVNKSTWTGTNDLTTLNATQLANYYGTTSIVKNGTYITVGTNDSNIYHTNEKIVANRNYPTFDNTPIPEEYVYTGGVQTVTLSPGTYKLEAWGAQGGSSTRRTGGKGSYATGTYTISARTTLYIYVGGQGGAGTGSIDNSSGYTDTIHYNGGYNGGGRAVGCGCGGGGMSHISTVANGAASTTDNGGWNTNGVLLVAGGGGVGSTGEQHSSSGYQGTGGMCITTRYTNSWGNDNAGGGGGWYGGKYVSGDDTDYSYAGSSYGSSLLTGFTSSFGQRSGNGLVKITKVS